MERGEVHRLIDRVVGVDLGCSDRVVLEGAVGDVRRLRSWVEAREVALARRIGEVSSFPEKSLADASRSTIRQSRTGAASRRDHRPGPRLR